MRHVCATCPDIAIEVYREVKEEPKDKARQQDKKTKKSKKS